MNNREVGEIPSKITRMPRKSRNHTRPSRAKSPEFRQRYTRKYTRTFHEPLQYTQEILLKIIYSRQIISKVPGGHPGARGARKNAQIWIGLPKKSPAYDCIHKEPPSQTPQGGGLWGEGGLTPPQGRGEPMLARHRSMTPHTRPPHQYRTKPN